jgi:type IV conjugative transfer system lipoprotein TraV
MGEGICGSVRQVYHDTQGSGDHAVTATPLPDATQATASSTVGVSAPGRNQHSAAATVAVAPAPHAAAAAATPAVSDGNADRRPDYVMPVSLAADGSLPLRTPPEVMRIWIAPFVTKEGDLMMSGYVFTELRERTWQLGGQSVLGAGELRPVALDPVMPVPIAPQDPSHAAPQQQQPNAPAGTDMRNAGMTRIQPPEPTARPLLRTSTGAQPATPQGGFWQASPSGPAVQ